ncbi:hypothetical protein AUR58_07185 [Coxiella burnetii]|uniref:Uncharacterized protein n=2 Tax=Coxiella burnetii TaxID=777 RepID=Q83DN7_COXBU|nr:hypothetical protein [Coxiella burnetii]NP_819690.1 hypothetical protein CBU_0660 [Coxiella burnetii RSA 493]ACI23117.1 hypothetical protein CBUD_0669a [Coxiella burnetii Dugway 5J108-111]ACJ18654.1 hypothetical protein CbuG_1347 [Coxiella burnetii CbuG_Q212]ACJ20750.1 hypothetical protein CbuK_1599 [Coxiella burnetii CbuK_Q154]AAO90204.1 hypothetical protein CBU_0660 [Coxiella burnetii RSA 493]AML48986.1 hypothetical protein AUR58_07185 [Coxiella burnetii]
MINYEHLLSTGSRRGPLATNCREPRQARKGATVAVDLGAEVRLLWLSFYFKEGL